MSFYFIAHVFLGSFAMSAYSLVNLGRINLLAVPKWVHTAGPIFVTLGSLSCIAAIITTLVNHDAVWVIATLAEMALGALIAGFLPMGARALITITSPISVTLILGDLWKFWYI